LRENRPIDTGWAGFTKFLEEDQKAQLSSMEGVRDGRLAAGAFLNAERDFQRASLLPRANPGWSDEVAQKFATLGERQKALDELIAKAGATSKFGGEAFLLARGYTTLIETSRQRGTAATKAMALVLAQQKPAAEKAESMSGSESDFTLFRDIRRRLGELNQTLAGTTDRTFSATEQAELPTLDAAVLGVSVDPTQRLHTYRFNLYRDALAMSNSAATETTPMIGRLGAVLGQIGTKQAALRERIDKYDGGGRESFQSAARQLLISAGDGGSDRFVDSYIKDVERELESQLGYPLARSGRDLTPDQVKALMTVSSRVRADISAPGLSDPLKKRLETACSRLLRIGEFASAVVPPAAGTPRGFRLILPKESDQRAALTRSGANSATAFAGRNYRTIRIGSKVLKPIWEKGDTAPWIAGGVSDPLAAIEFFEAPDPKPEADAKYTFGSGNWGVLRALEAGSQRRNDGKTWDIILPLRDTHGESRLQLTIEFDAPLPPLEQWPR
jgi:hypothetical protein